VDARLRGVAAPGLFRAEQLRCSSGSGGLRGAALLLAEHGQGQTQPAELLDDGCGNRLVHGDQRHGLPARGAAAEVEGGDVDAGGP